MAVKCILFKTLFLFMSIQYDVALWTIDNKGSLRKLSPCYNKCVKLFFGGFWQCHKSVDGNKHAQF